MSIRIACITIFALTILYSPAQSQSYQQAIRASRDSVFKRMIKQRIPGLALTVIVNDKVILSEGFGFADLEQKVKVDPSRTKFRIGSISKSLTAAGLGKLYEQGKIVLDSSIYFYLPEYSAYRYKPTVRQVAGHIAGVRHYRGDEWASAKSFNTVSDGLAMFKDDSLEFKPGARYGYSSYGFNLLSAVMEKAAGQDFLEFMQKEVFDPLGLNNTAADRNASIIDFRTRFYELRDSKLLNAPYVDNSYKWAGGGFISTSEDIANFGSSLLQNTLLTRETIALFTQPQKLDDGSYTHYGIGFFSGKDHKQKLHFGHSGGSVGGTSDMVIYPEEKVVVVILTNLSSVDLAGIARDIAHLYMKK